MGQKHLKVDGRIKSASGLEKMEKFIESRQVVDFDENS